MRRRAEVPDVLAGDVLRFADGVGLIDAVATEDVDHAERVGGVVERRMVEAHTVKVDKQINRDSGGGETVRQVAGQGCAVTEADNHETRRRLLGVKPADFLLEEVRVIGQTEVGLDEPQRVEIIANAIEIAQIERVDPLDNENMDAILARLRNTLARMNILVGQFLDRVNEPEAAAQERKGQHAQEPGTGPPISVSRHTAPPNPLSFPHTPRFASRDSIV